MTDIYRLIRNILIQAHDRLILTWPASVAVILADWPLHKRAIANSNAGPVAQEDTTVVCQQADGIELGNGVERIPFPR